MLPVGKTRPLYSSIIPIARNVKVVLALIWMLILRFQIMASTDTLSNNPMQDAKDRVLKWWRDMIGDKVEIVGIESFGG
jgi:hypothetical protein